MSRAARAWIRSGLGRVAVLSTPEQYFYAGYHAALAGAKGLARACDNCVSSQPNATHILCGLCCGPDSPNTKYERIVHVVRRNSPAAAQVPR